MTIDLHFSEGALVTSGHERTHHCVSDCTSDKLSVLHIMISSSSRTCSAGFTAFIEKCLVENVLIRSAKISFAGKDLFPEAIVSFGT